MIDQREWLGHIEPNPMVLKLKELAEEYHRVTEIYDRKVCTGWDERDQCAMPQTTVQRSLVTANATRRLLNYQSKQRSLVSVPVL